MWFLVLKLSLCRISEDESFEGVNLLPKVILLVNVSIFLLTLPDILRSISPFHLCLVYCLYGANLRIINRDFQLLLEFHSYSFVYFNNIVRNAS